MTRLDRQSRRRKASVTQLGALDGSNSNTSTPAPAPRKPESKDEGNNETPIKSAGKRKNMSSPTVGVDGDDDDNEEVSPLNKQAVKIEKVEDLDDGAFNRWQASLCPATATGLVLDEHLKR